MQGKIFTLEIIIFYANFSQVITRKSVDPQLAWPPYSPDLNPCDAFLWVFLIDRLYTERKLPTVTQLKQQISFVFHSMPLVYIQSAIDKFVKNIDACIASEGKHFKK